MKSEHNVLIAGGGVAGISAAIQLRKIGIGFVLVEERRIGGIINDIYSIENYPGYFDPITGKNYTKLLKKHLDVLKIEPLMKRIDMIHYDGENFISTLGDDEIESNYLILATGSKPILPVNYESYPDDLKEHVHFDLESVEPKKTTILIGGGPQSYDYALSLSLLGGEVIFLEMNNAELPYYYQLKRVSRVDSIKLITGVSIRDINYVNGKVEVLASYKGKQGIVKGDQIFTAKGREPDTSILSDKLFDKGPRLVRDNKLYYTGDCYHGEFRFITNSAGDGIAAAKAICQDMRFNRLFKM